MRARPLLDNTARTKGPAVLCHAGEHEDCEAWLAGIIDGVGSIPVAQRRCWCGCHMSGNPWPFPAEGYQPPERTW